MNSAGNGSVLLYRSSPILFGVTLSVLPVVGITSMMMAKYAKVMAKKSKQLSSALTTFSLEKLSSITTILLNNQIENEIKRYDFVNHLIRDDR
jgi:ABC-type bacteriocin/lantibiotic exporter with double-glycine peptidase domain